MKKKQPRIKRARSAANYEKAGTIQLDSRPSRPLTSRECAKILCGVLGSMANPMSQQRAPMTRQVAETWLSCVALVIQIGHEDLARLAQAVMITVRPQHQTILLDRLQTLASIAGAISGFSGVDPVLEAILWLLESDNGQCAMEEMFGSPTPGTAPPPTPTN